LFIAKLARVSSFSFFKAIELSVLHVLSVSKLALAPSVGLGYGAFSEAMVYVNGLRAYNPYLQLYQGDVMLISDTTFRSNVSENLAFEGVRGREATLPHPTPSLHLTAYSVSLGQDSPSFFRS